jgi:hypothetical protein
MTIGFSLPYFESILRKYGETNSTILCLDYLMYEGTIKFWRPLDHS